MSEAEAGSRAGTEHGDGQATKNAGDPAGVESRGRTEAAPRLAPCPRSPNCVSSQAEDPSRRVDPLSFRGPAAAAFGQAAETLAGLPRCRIVHRDDVTIRAEARTPVLRFVDDVELVLDTEASCIHVRSASRVGWWDLGVNRRRIEELRRRFSAQRRGESDEGPSPGST